MDRISNLTDDLLLKIVSSLPTKDVVATMILSKRWRFLWTMLPKLDFDYDYDYDSDSKLKRSEYERFVKYVDRSLVFNRAPVLETLKFRVGPFYTSEDLATWMRIGMVRQVREIEISACADNRSIVELPKSLYTCKKLEVLKLAYVDVDDVPDDFCFPSLKSLHLVCATIGTETEETYCKLFSSCPVLEELVLDIMASFRVEIPTLQRLSIRDTCNPPNDGDDDRKVVIIVPSLKFLNFVVTCDNLCLFENMPEVVEANVKVVFENPDKLLECLPSVKRLCLCLSASMLHHRIGFDHLVDLELCVSASGWWDLLTWMLQSSPKLQVLKLCPCKEYLCTIHSFKSNKGRWRGPTSVPECLMFHLHTFKWIDYNQNDKEKNIAAYILKNARQLKTAGFSWRWCSKEEKSLKINELVSLPRASSSCQLILD
ncbi:unnamed protein product [Microthlaspi erraticum]|uniref:F-box domain-containing protein n=1 Tax=Microthlaspi erraticum TaxID=1685480 RepID=A0A6D2IND9_9BRAS|nr:unnamed protein product [Microthlaspi erraticum]